jgi:transposase
VPKGRLPLGLATACTDLGAQVSAVQARIAALEAALAPVAERLPASALLRSIPGVGPTVAAILLAEIGDIAWYTQFSQLRKLAGLDIVRVQSGQYAGQQRISKCGRSLLRWALYQAAGGLARSAAGRPRLAALLAKRRGDRFAFFKATVELAAKQLRVVWGVWRSGVPYDPVRAGGIRRQRC